MVYLHFPSNLTEEEQMLQAKYQKLRRKKKALQNLKTPKPEPEPLAPSKRPLDSKDAKEMAKKMIRSGAIKVPERTLPITEKTTFKRSIGLERKLSAVEKAPSGYQPFSTSHPEDEVHESRLKTKGLYDNFISVRDTDDKVENRTSNDLKPRQGNTIYVYGHSITEELLTNAFNSFGNIININMEAEKKRGFITFDKVESAEKAIAEMNGSMVSSVQLKVALARRQPTIESNSSDAASTNWSTLATSHSQKGSHKDKRNLVTYDDSPF